MVTTVELALRHYRRRAVDVGVRITFLVLAILIVYPLLPGNDVEVLWAYAAVIVVGTAVALLIRALPWERLLEEGRADRILYLWSAADIGLITLLAALTGGSSSEVFWMYVLTTMFSAAIYSREAQVGVLALTYLAYLPVAFSVGPPPQPGALAFRLATLGAVALFASFLTREYASEVTARHAIGTESERRAQLLATVAASARGMSQLDPDAVLAAVTDAALRLGFDAANLCVLEPDGRTYMHRFTRGLGDDNNLIHPADSGIAGVVLEARDTVTIADYSSHERADPDLRAAGFRGTIASPVWSLGRVAAVLVASSTTRDSFTSEEVEAFELLAAQAGAALENARRFAEERRAVVELAKLDRLKSDFVSNVSHELRTPLTVIMGLSNTLERHWDRLDEEQRRELITRVEVNAETLSWIISALLDFSRIEVGALELVAAPTKLGEILEASSSRVAPLLERHRFTLDVDPSIEVVADRALLDRVIENLLVNAGKHTPPGTSVVLTARAETGHATVEVRDDGPGIPPDELSHVTERFFRGGDPNTRDTRGLGLGLTLCAEIVRLHGSELEIESVIGGGTSFRFTLPLYTVTTLR